jgi:hypothetical protein
LATVALEPDSRGQQGIGPEEKQERGASMIIARSATLIVCVLVLTTPALAENPPSIGGSGGDPAVQWLYPSPLCVEETITDAGGGRWEYSYSFVNVDAAHIWHFGVWSNLPTVVTTAVWDTHPLWDHFPLHIEDVHEAYDGRNLDPGILWMATTWGPDWPNTTDPIVPNEAVAGFAYQAPAFDDSPKWYYYETVEGGWAPENGGYLAAVGMTCVPTPTEAVTWGRIKASFE